MKKANAVLDGITILIIIVLFGIFSVIGLKTFTQLNTDLQTGLQMNESKAISSDLHTKYPSLLDNLFIFMFVLLIVFTIVSVFLLDTHPIFFIITVILLVGFFLSAILLGNVYHDLMSDSEFSSDANQFTYMGWVMSHILQLMVAVGFILVISLFIKFKGV